MNPKYDYSKLRGLITEHYGTLSNFAKVAKIGTTTLNSRLKSDTYFDQSEMELFSRLLKLNQSDVNSVFFTHK